jgi:concanavalin A-like lectin/glucanase superfamily protein
MNATTGMALYIDGVQVATDPNTISETDANPMFWRVGCGNLADYSNFWTGPNPPTAQTNYPFNGSLDEATVYTSALTAQQITFLYWIR